MFGNEVPPKACHSQCQHWQKPGEECQQESSLCLVRKERNWEREREKRREMLFTRIMPHPNNVDIGLFHHKQTYFFPQRTAWHLHTAVEKIMANPGVCTSIKNTKKASRFSLQKQQDAFLSPLQARHRLFLSPHLSSFLSKNTSQSLRLNTQSTRAVSGRV